MKTFKQYLKEEGPSLRMRVLPAIRHDKDAPGTKGLKIGKRGFDHSELREKHADADGNPLKGEAGYYDPLHKKFHTRDELGGYDSTRLLGSDERDQRTERLRGNSNDTTDRMTDAQRMRKYGTMEEDTIQEGNPLGRVMQHDKQGRHSVFISPHRANLTKDENDARMKSLKKSLRAQGYGYRNTEGKWNEGDGVGREKSLHVYAKSSGKEGAAELTKDMKTHADTYGQDAILHRSPQGSGTAIYTNDTKDQKKGDKVGYGPTRYNVDNPYGETTFKTRKPEKARPKLTFKPREK